MNRNLNIPLQSFFLRSGLLVLTFLAANAFAQEQTLVMGTITYIAGDSYYISLGRKAGIADSTLLYVVPGKDTVATLKVYATSSQSSVAKALQTKRALKIGDPIEALVISTPPPPPPTTVLADTSRPDTSHSAVITKQDTIRQIKPPAKPGESLVNVQGRIGLQYYTNIQSSIDQTYTQPGIVLNLRGNIPGSHIKFETYGNVRSLVLGTHSPFSSNSTSETRLYRLSVEYDDTLNRISLGRIISPYAPTIGYTDGGMYVRRMGEISLGTSIGYEPSFLQRTISTSMKKFTLFGSYQGTTAMRPFMSIAYARTFYTTIADREVVSSTATAAITDDIYLYAQGDLDLRSKSGTNFNLAPRITSIYTNLNYRVSTLFSLGLGYSGWRPTYSFATVQALPDSFIDNTLRSTMNITGQLYLPAGISFYHSYSPRSTDAGFGKEYLDNSSLSFNNVFHSGFILRSNLSFNSTTYGMTRGIGANLQKTFLNIADINLRVQTYQNDLKQLNQRLTSQSYAVDIMSALTRSLSLWFSAERTSNEGIKSYNIYSELSLSF